MISQASLKIAQSSKREAYIVRRMFLLTVSIFFEVVFEEALSLARASVCGMYQNLQLFQKPKAHIRNIYSILKSCLMPWKGVLKRTKPCGSVRVFVLCAVVAWQCPFGAVCELILISDLTVTNLNSTESPGMLKLCHFPGTKIQNNLSYKIVRPFVSCV